MKTDMKRLFEVSYITGKNGVKYRLDSESVKVRYSKYKMMKKHRLAGGLNLPLYK